MYADPKRIKTNRLPVYLDGYVNDRLNRLVELQGGEKSAVGRAALERGLELMERELMHAAQCGASTSQMRDVHPAYVGA